MQGWMDGYERTLAPTGVCFDLRIAHGIRKRANCTAFIARLCDGEGLALADLNVRRNTGTIISQENCLEAAIHLAICFRERSNRPRVWAKAVVARQAVKIHVGRTNRCCTVSREAGTGPLPNFGMEELGFITWIDANPIIIKWAIEIEGNVNRFITLVSRLVG